MIDPAHQATLEEFLGIALFWAIAIVLTGQWLIMTFMWPRTAPERAVWSKSTAFLSIVVTRLVLYYTGNDRFPFPIGPAISASALALIVYFGKVYLWDTWIKGKHQHDGGEHEPKRIGGGADFVGRYWTCDRDDRAGGDPGARA